MHMRITVATLLTLGLATAYASAQQVTKQTVPGVTNFARVETTIACGGATTAEALPELKKMGFNSVINLRQASEQGANIPEAEAAAKAANLNYVHIPFNAVVTRSRRCRQVPGRDHQARESAGLRPLRQRQPRRRDVDDQTADGGPLGRRQGVD